MVSNPSYINWRNGIHQKGTNEKDNDTRMHELFKTTMCRNLTTCKFGNNCRYAHTKEEIRRIRFCAFGETCNKPNCRFAHSKNEITPPRKCSYGDECNRMNCRFEHPVDGKWAKWNRTVIFKHIKLCLTSGG